MTILGVASSQSGHSVSLGDVNGDEYDDVIIGAPDTGDIYRSGVVYVVFGSKSPVSTVDLTALGGGLGITIFGMDTLSYCGTSVSAGDVNGDLLDDVIIGCPYENIQSGVTYAVFSSPSPPEVFHLDTLGTDGILINGVHSGDFLG
jgi:hypothetical protein